MKMRLKKPLKASHVLLLGFIGIILLGSLLLRLPFAHNPGIHISYLDSLFISTSAVCVTGLVTVDVAATFSLFGRTIIAILILLGGLGFASMVISVSMLFGMNIGLNQRAFIKEAYNLSSVQGTLRIVRAVTLAALVFQSVGILVEFFVFHATYGALDALGHAAFNTISAFNNAGFDLMGKFQSLTNYRSSIAMNITTALLIIIGGSGFFVISDVVKNHSWKKLSMHSKIVLSMNAILIVVGFLFYAIIEHLEPLAAFFQSVTTRTAGFNTVDLNTLSQAGLLFTIFLMFIGASPGSTGGGIKTTTMFALVLSLGSLMFGHQNAVFKRRIGSESILKAFQVLLLSILLIGGGSILILIFEGDRFNFLSVLFETVSAFATVGLSMGITTQLGGLSKLVLIVVMFAGRVGPITIATSFTKKSTHLSYVEEQVFIG